MNGEVVVGVFRVWMDCFFFGGEVNWRGELVLTFILIRWLIK